MVRVKYKKHTITVVLNLANNQNHLNGHLSPNYRFLASKSVSLCICIFKSSSDDSDDQPSYRKQFANSSHTHTDHAHMRGA